MCIRDRIKSAAGNRFVRDGAGHICERDNSFYGALAMGGVGLIIVGHADIDNPLGMRHSYSIHISEKTLPGFIELNKVIHKYDCPSFLQIQHAGPSYHDEEFGLGLKPLSASSIPREELPESGIDVAKELTIAEIEELVEKFANAADLAQKAGFDGVEVNAGTDHLVNSFLSRVWNRRQDEYGCADLKSRSKFACEVIQGIKKRVGNDFPVAILINGAEFGIPNGITLEDSRGFSRLLQEAGADAIQVRAYGFEDYYDIIRPEGVFYPEPPKPLAQGIEGGGHGKGALVPLSANIKQEVSIPVIAIGRLDPVIGEKALRQGKADFIAMTRRLLADPELPNKIADGRFDDIVPCMGCTHCQGLTKDRPPVQCRVNPVHGHQDGAILRQVNKRKRR